MYPPLTRLRLREPKSTEDKPFPYDEVEVIGQSPQTHSGSDFAGADSQGVIIRPLTSFSQNLDEPLGKLQMMYEVTYMPEPVQVIEIERRIIDGNSSQAGATPEEIFKQAAAVAPKVRKPKTQPSPLA